MLYRFDTKGDFFEKDNKLYNLLGLCIIFSKTGRRDMLVNILDPETFLAINVDARYP